MRYRLTGAPAWGTLRRFEKAGVDVAALAAQLQDEGAKSFVKSWEELMGVITTKRALLSKPPQGKPGRFIKDQSYDDQRSLRTLAARRLIPHQRHAWKALQTHHDETRELTLKELFATDPSRGERMVVEGEGLLLDYSKNRITADTLKLLISLARESGLKERIDAMVQGVKINTTEQRCGVARCTSGATGIVDRCRWRKCCTESAHRARQDGAVRNSCEKRRVERAYGQAHSQRREHRDRGVGLGSSYGLRGAQVL